MILAAITLALTVGAQQPGDKAALNEELWAAARAGDVARVTKALDQGADVNSGNRYKATALFFAADRGHVEVIKLLLDRGADINGVDTFYKFRPIMMATMNNHTPAVILLLERGSEGAGGVLAQAAGTGNKTLVDAALKGKGLTRAEVQGALAAAKRGGDAEIIAAVEKRLGDFPAAATVNVPTAVLQTYAGRYGNEQMTVAVTLKDNTLFVQPPGQPPLTLVPTSQDTFSIAEAPGPSVAFVGRGGMIERLVFTSPQGAQNFPRLAEGAAATPPPAAAAPPSS
jgi:hypothetical protein